MIIINDEQRLLNLNHMAIYLMLTSDEKARYEKKLKKLNKETTVTRGLFHFDIAEKGDAPYVELPEDMKQNMRHYNVLVRLVNSIHGIFCYGMEEIDLEDEMTQIVSKLQALVDSVCREDIKQLEILCSRQTTTAIAATKMYRDNNIVKQIFEAALTGEDVDTAKANALLTKSSASSDMATSLDLASAATDDKKASKAQKELCERERPFEHPTITATIKNVKTGKVYKGGREETKLGVELTIDGTVVPVWFGSTDQSFLYIITLMAYKEGRTIGRDDFLDVDKLISKRPARETEIRRARVETIAWLRKRFAALRFNQQFDKWYKGMTASDAHPFDTAIAVIRTKLWNFLNLEHRNAYYYSFVVNTGERYKTRIRKSSIKVDAAIAERIEKE